MIDSRIQAVMNFVSIGSRVVDVGADHGYLSIELIKSGRATKVIATEKNIGPFEAACKNISAVELDNYIDVRFGDGLTVLSPGEVDTICIAGMGGALIEKILNDSPEIVSSARQLILQPMNAVEKIRAWINKNDWTIDDEDLAESAGIIYGIISAVKFPNTSQKIFKRDSSPLMKKFLSQRLEKLQHVLNEMSKSSVASTSDKFYTLNNEVELLRQKLSQL